MSLARLIFVSQTWPHMGSVSGYAPLAAALRPLLGDRMEMITPADVWQQRQHGDAIQGNLARDPSLEYLPWIDDIQRFGCAAVLARLDAEPHAIALLTAGEDQLCRAFLDQPPAVQRRIFVVFHQPPSWFEATAPDARALRELGGVVCLSNRQADYFRGRGVRKVIVSRLGVNHQFFGPASEPPAADAPVLVVGQWLRDFDLLEQTMRLFWKSQPERKLHCLVGKAIDGIAPLLRLAEDPRTEILPRHSNEGLRDLYRHSRVTYLPLSDAVANNAAVEAAACAVPLVVTDLPSTREYLKDVNVFFAAAGNPHDHARALVEATASPPDLNREGHERFVAVHDWPAIGANLLRDLELAHAR
jgi:glycosyltransferase involved in cell wall biosynthesis